MFRNAQKYLEMRQNFKKFPRKFGKAWKNLKMLMCKIVEIIQNRENVNAIYLHVNSRNFQDIYRKILEAFKNVENFKICTYIKFGNVIERSKCVKIIKHVRNAQKIL